MRALEDRLRAEGLVPHTIGRNHYTADAPLAAVLKLMEQCSGAVILALERDYYPNGIEKRGGPNQKPTQGIRLPTPWNHVEAAIAYTKGRPLLVIVESGLRQNGLLERGYDWYVQTVMLEPGALATPEFNGVLADWKLKLHQRPTAQSTAISASDLTRSRVDRRPKTDAIVGSVDSCCSCDCRCIRVRRKALSIEEMPGRPSRRSSVVERQLPSCMSRVHSLRPLQIF